MNKILFSLLATFTLLMNGMSLSSAEETAGQAADQTNPMLNAEMKAQMEAYATPNENHEILKALEGNWKAEVKMWMDPAAEPEVSEGTAESTMILGGRYLEQKFNGTAMGQPFEGRGLIGYDNLRKEYRSVWADTMSTGIMVSSGVYNKDDKTISEKGTMSCPIMGGDRDYRAVTTFIDNDHYTYESFMNDESGKEMKTMLITYTRQ